MSELLAQSLVLAWRQLRNLARQPWYIAITLAQPVVCLLLAASLFSRVAALPGFGGMSYVSFVSPGLIVMGALLLGGWLGVGVLGDIERGVLDRFLVTPVRRGALVGGRLIHLSVQVVVQSAILVVLAEVRGAEFVNGPAGMLGLVAVAVLVAVPVGALSFAIALTARRHETLIAAVSMVLLPLLFVSTLFMPASLVPEWIAIVARYNPVDWAGVAARSTVAAGHGWEEFVARCLGLVLLAAGCVTLAVHAFRRYVASV